MFWAAGPAAQPFPGIGAGGITGADLRPQSTRLSTDGGVVKAVDAPYLIQIEVWATTGQYVSECIR
jgi:hypothetical protein